MKGLDASKSRLARKVLADARISIYARRPQRHRGRQDRRPRPRAAPLPRGGARRRSPSRASTSGHRLLLAARRRLGARLRPRRGHRRARQPVDLRQPAPGGITEQAVRNILLLPAEHQPAAGDLAARAGRSRRSRWPTTTTTSTWGSSERRSRGAGLRTRPYDPRPMTVVIEGRRALCERCVTPGLPSASGVCSGASAAGAGRGHPPSSRPPPFTRAFMRFPIDAVFLDGEVRVLRVAAGLRPWRAAGCRGARAVLELSSGESERRGVRPGDRLVPVPG